MRAAFFVFEKMSPSPTHSCAYVPKKFFCILFMASLNHIIRFSSSPAEARFLICEVQEESEQRPFWNVRGG